MAKNQKHVFNTGKPKKKGAKNDGARKKRATPIPSSSSSTANNDEINTADSTNSPVTPTSDSLSAFAVDYDEVTSASSHGQSLNRSANNDSNDMETSLDLADENAVVLGSCTTRTASNQSNSTEGSPRAHREPEYPHLPAQFTGAVAESATTGEATMQVPLIVITEHADAEVTESQHGCTATSAVNGDDANLEVQPPSIEAKVDHGVDDTAASEPDDREAETFEAAPLLNGKAVEENNDIEENKVMKKNYVMEEKKVVEDNKVMEETEVIPKHNVSAKNDVDTGHKISTVDNVNAGSMNPSSSHGPFVQEHAHQVQDNGSDNSTTDKSKEPVSHNSLVSTVANALEVIACEAGDLPGAMAGFAHQETLSDDEEEIGENGGGHVNVLKMIACKAGDLPEAMASFAHQEAPSDDDEFQVKEDVDSSEEIRAATAVSDHLEKSSRHQSEPRTSAAGSSSSKMPILEEENESTFKSVCAFGGAGQSATNDIGKVPIEEGRTSQVVVHIPEGSDRSASGSTLYLLGPVVRSHDDEQACGLSGMQVSQKMDSQLVKKGPASTLDETHPHDVKAVVPKVAVEPAKSQRTSAKMEFTGNKESFAESTDIPYADVKPATKPKASVSFTPDVQKAPRAVTDANVPVKTPLVRIGSKLRIPSYARSTTASENRSAKATKERSTPATLGLGKSTIASPRVSSNSSLAALGEIHKTSISSPKPSSELACASSPLTSHTTTMPKTSASFRKRMMASTLRASNSNASLRVWGISVARLLQVRVKGRPRLKSLMPSVRVPLSSPEIRS
ncbi:hypothetical protein K491DRAFT_784850 [Lophiostoma macrostomum CBS 122681]|uniref:Uncharacterized protein n=1 Tax=Lophiostoma macrostomum CBS 122681 TaxID=1314788 RepID=A0A6A6SHL0_9PLEO|nr:hypothetical protein K491DRAFT_784850 [Lophiostoma macrostomum CBS 122681]